MSVLETPRLFFRGQTTWDPITTNNYDTLYDEGSSTTVFSSPDEKAVAFRQTAIDDVTANGNWNPDGTYRSRFFDTRVTGFDIGDGPVTDANGPDSDPIVGTPVRFIGMLVDLEPYGSYSSQLFFDTMSFGIDGGCQIKARRKTRMIARYINFGRYKPKTSKDGLPIAGVASVTWQTSFPTSHLTIGTTRSPVLARFRELLKRSELSELDGSGRVKGLTVRWTAYRTAYYDTLDAAFDNKGDPIVKPELAEELQQKLRLGGFQPNPARSELVGVLGLWREGEPAHEPGDRALLSPYSVSPKKALLASAHARASGDVLTIDLSNSVPEIDKDGTKIDLGRMLITAHSPDPAVVADTVIGSISYDQYRQEAYNLHAGIVTLHAPGVEKVVENMTLSLTCPDRKQQGPAELMEQPLRAIAEVPNIYLDQGQVENLSIRVLERGRPVGAGVKIDVVMTDNSYQTQTSPPRAQAITDQTGLATLPITGRAGSVQGYILLAHGAPTPPQLNTQVNTYALVRTLSTDGATAAKPPTWDNVYGIVLKNWKAMAPCMDNWMRFDDEQQVRSFKPVLKMVTDPDRFEAFNFMPVTRDMTQGARTLLYKFLDSSPNELPEVVATATTEPEKELDLAGLSRSLRQA